MGLPWKQHYSRGTGGGRAKLEFITIFGDEPGEEGGEVAHSQHSEGWKRYKRAPREKEWSGKCVSCCPACFHTAAHHCFMLVCV